MVVFSSAKRFRSWAILALAAVIVTAGSARAASEAPDPLSREGKSYLRLYMMPTFPLRIDWSSPRSLLGTSLAGLFVNRVHTIGHVTVEISCGNGVGSNRVDTGATQAGPKYPGLLLMSRQVGFTLLESGWPGRLESPKEIEDAIRTRGKKNELLGIVTYLVSEETCRRLIDYHRQYSMHASRSQIFYGFGPRPRRMEGSGCSAYGASYVEVAGLMTPQLRSEWATTRKIALNMMAGYGNEKISIPRIFRMATSNRWAKPDEPHMLLEFFDPDKMYDWVRKLSGSPKLLSQWGGSTDRARPYGLRMNVPAITFDMRDIETPVEPIFTGTPALVPFSDISVIREDKVYAPDGSFEIRP